MVVENMEKQPSSEYIRSKRSDHGDFVPGRNVGTFQGRCAKNIGALGSGRVGVVLSGTPLGSGAVGSVTVSSEYGGGGSIQSSRRPSSVLLENARYSTVSAPVGLSGSVQMEQRHSFGSVQVSPVRESPRPVHRHVQVRPAFFAAPTHHVPQRVTVRTSLLPQRDHPETSVQRAQQPHHQFQPQSQHQLHHHQRRQHQQQRQQRHLHQHNVPGALDPHRCTQICSEPRLVGGFSERMQAPMPAEPVDRVQLQTIQRANPFVAQRPQMLDPCSAAPLPKAKHVAADSTGSVDIGAVPKLFPRGRHLQESSRPRGSPGQEKRVTITCRPDVD